MSFISLGSKSTTSHGRFGRVIAATMLATALLLPSGPAAAGDAEDSAETQIERQVSANEARRAAYRYLADQGYSRKIGPGGARVRSITRDGDTWILQVAISNGTSVQSDRSMLYIDAKSALVSEVAPADRPSRVASE